MRNLNTNTKNELQEVVTFPIELVKFEIYNESNNFSATRNYVKDNIVINNNKFYRANDAITAGTFNPSEWTEIANPNLYLSTAYKTIEFENNTYNPGSGVLGFSAIEETKDIKTNSINVDLNGVPNTIISALEEVHGQAIGGIVTIYQAFWDEEAGEIVQHNNQPDVYQKWKGIINSFSTTEENQVNGSVRISIECKSTIGTLLDTKSGRYTSQASIQSITDNSDDLSMEFVPSLVDWNPNFGAEE